MHTGMEQTIAPPKLRPRRWGLLLDVAEEITLPPRSVQVADGVERQSLPIPTNKIGAGATFTPLGCQGLTSADPNFCEDASNTNTREPIEIPEFQAFSIFDIQECSSLDVDIDWLNEKLDERRRVMVSEQLAVHLLSGGDTSDDDLFVPDFVTTAQVPIEGPQNEVGMLAILESHLATSLHGAEGIIWLPPGALSAVSYLLEMDGGVWRSPGGHAVVGDPGFASGEPPTGHTKSPDTAWAYASGPVGYKLGPVRFHDQTAVQYLDRERNIITGRLMGEALVTFDPCTVGAVEVQLPIEIGS